MSYADGQYEQWACPACGREVPAAFDICWNCGGDREGEPGVDLTADEAESESADLAEAPGPLYRRMHRRTGLTMVWSAGGWFATMAGSGLLVALIGPDGHRAWTLAAKAVAGFAGLAFAIALGSTLALVAFLLSPLWENYGEDPPDAAPDVALGAGSRVATPEALGFRSDRGGVPGRHSPPL